MATIIAAAVGSLLTTFGLGYWAGSSGTSEEVKSSDSNTGMINNDIKIIEKESKIHVEIILYIIVAIICGVSLIKCIKCIRKKKADKAENLELECVA